MEKIGLSRQIGLFPLLLYGLGNILGAGIYVLVGKVAGISGYLSVFSFVVACIIALFTALSYMELASRYPVSAGEAVYIQEGIGSKMLSVGVGVIIAIAGLFSSATLARGFVGYLEQFFQINIHFAVILLVVALTAISIKGIKASVMVAASLTLIEVFGLVLMIYYGSEGIVHPKTDLSLFLPAFTLSDFSLIFFGAFLAFYAFLGFEDMVNIAEEVKEPAKTFPKAIAAALLISTVLYILIVLVALDTLSLDALKNSRAPFADIYQKLTGNEPLLISFIGMFAVVNGALIQLIMASRIIYGMASRGWLPSGFTYVNKSTQTPVTAILFVGGITIVFALLFDILFLAGFSSLLVLVIFTLVNISLIRIKLKSPTPEGVIKVPFWVPCLGVGMNIILMIMTLMAA